MSRRNKPPNRFGCKPDGDVCVAHDVPLECRHGCAKAITHQCVVRKNAAPQMANHPARGLTEVQDAMLGLANEVVIEEPARVVILEWLLSDHVAALLFRARLERRRAPEEPVAWMVEHENGNYEIYRSEYDADSHAKRIDSEAIPLVRGPYVDKP